MNGSSDREGTDALVAGVLVVGVMLLIWVFAAWIFTVSVAWALVVGWVVVSLLPFALRALAGSSTEERPFS